MPTLLFFVKKDDPILREVMPSVQDFNDAVFLKTVEDMCFSILPEQLKKADAAFEGAAGMAANQWGIKQRIFIFTPHGSNEDELTVVVNPSYQPYLRFNEKKPKLVAGFESCFSVPMATGLVNRYDAIKATYYDVKGKKIECLLEGWEARVFQHETDHLDGKLYDGQLDSHKGPDCLKRIVFNDKEEMEDFWNNGPSE